MATETPSLIDDGSQIELCDVPTVIKWEDDQSRAVGTSLSSTPVSLDMDFNSTARTASFRLRIALLQRGSDKPVSLFLFIDPSQIRSLATPGIVPSTHDAATPDDDTTCLQFQLSSPASLVVPTEPLRLKDKSQLSTMRAVRWAARQTLLTVHLRHDSLTTHQLKSLSDAAYVQFTPSLRYKDIARLYGGRGGKVLDASTDESSHDHPPPSYDDVPAPPPMAPTHYGSDTATSSKKRRRSDSPAQVFDVTLLEKLCRKIADEQFEKTRAELSNMETRLVQHLDQGMDERINGLKEALEPRFQNLDVKIQELRRDFEAKTKELEDGTRELDDNCKAGMDRLDEWIQEVSDDIDKRVDYEVDDRVTGIKMDLEDFVQYELSSTADDLKHRISEASVYIEFKD